MELHEYFASIAAFADYPTGVSGFAYQFSRLPELDNAFAPFDLPATAGEGDTLTRARRVMQWVADHTAYDGASPLGPAKPDKIIRFAIEASTAPTGRFSSATRWWRWTSSPIPSGSSTVPVTRAPAIWPTSAIAM